MRIVLMCGGSGKRLWPFSNEIRSKVFLKLLNSEDGSKESMIERICRQLDEVGLLKDTCIITHYSQVEITRKYVGESIPIISEPYKRGTYPAVVLATMYLHEQLNVDPDETICILPVDTYVDSAFFGLLNRFPDVITQAKVNLALLGTKPTMPSDQFGYIVPVLPKDQNEYAAVRHFIEKPNEQAAAHLIEHEALWNCGVFAFPLRFMLDHLKAKGQTVQVDNWLSSYKQRANTSFDREVVEHTPQIVVMGYEGYWHDVGSWKALTPFIAENVIGTGQVSEDSKQTHLINELPYPIEIIGVPDIIVAANSDGILIANKEKSHLIKDRLSHVTKLPRHVEKRWGFYQIVRHLKDDQGQESMIKLLKMDQESQTSYHTHDQRDESLTILSGVADILVEDKLYRLSAGGVLHIPAGSRHGIKAVSALELIEVCLGHDLAEEDIQRISMIW